MEPKGKNNTIMNEKNLLAFSVAITAILYNIY